MTTRRLVLRRFLKSDGEGLYDYLSDLFPAHNALGFLFHDAYEAVEKSGVKLYH